MKMSLLTLGISLGPFIRDKMSRDLTKMRFCHSYELVVRVTYSRREDTYNGSRLNFLQFCMFRIVAIVVIS